MVVLSCRCLNLRINVHIPATETPASTPSKDTFIRPAAADPSALGDCGGDSFFANAAGPYELGIGGIATVLVRRVLAEPHDVAAHC